MPSVALPLAQKPRLFSSATPIAIAAYRASTAEAVHRVHAVAVRDGSVVAAAGNPELVTFIRSSAKPLQALPLVRACPDIGDAELAIACASHQAQPDQLEAVCSLLRRSGASEADLECGPGTDTKRTALHHECSGKHAGMLLACRVNGWSTEGYRLPGHPLQKILLRELASAADLDQHEISIGVDGCGVSTYAFPLARMALAFSRIAQLDGGDRVCAAMRARPDLVGGEGSPDTDLMRTLPGWIAKWGAEGLLCASAPSGLGVALKCEDGSQRPLLPALATVFTGLGMDGFDEFTTHTVTNNRGEQVGTIQPITAGWIPD